MSRLEPKKTKTKHVSYEKETKQKTKLTGPKQ
jgi:hypothetical protein